MELMQPTITVQNTDADAWLMRWQQRLNDHEAIDVTMAVRKLTAAPITELQAQLLDQLIEYATRHRDALRAGS